MSVIYVNADWSAIVPAGSAEAAYGVQPKDAKRLGLDKLPLLDEAEAPELLESETPEVLTTANLIPEAKEAPTPANKAAPKPATKGAARKELVDGDRN